MQKNVYKADIKENLVKAYDKWEEIFEDFSDWLLERHPTGTTLPRCARWPSNFFTRPTLSNVLT